MHSLSHSVSGLNMWIVVWFRLNGKRNSKKGMKSPSKSALSPSDEHKTESHCFGDRRYLYWDSCKGHGLYIRAKWTDLKDEVLNNSLCSISLPQWSCLWRKATITHSTNRALKTVAFKHWKMGSGVQRHAQRFGIKGDLSPFYVLSVFRLIIR